MSNLFATMNNTAQALRTYDRALSVVQNNIQNAQTPGYARQRQSFVALPFQPAAGLLGGVKAGIVESGRDRYAEASVQNSLSSLGYYSFQAGSLAEIDQLLSLQNQNGIPEALGRMFQSFSAWSVNPNSTLARQTVIAAAGNAASAFRQTAASLDQKAQQTQLQARDFVAQINSLASAVSGYNAYVRAHAEPDASADANVHQALDALSELANFTTIAQPDGTISVLLGGQTALVVGENTYPISMDVSFGSGAPPALPDGMPPMRIRSADGTEITGAITGGTLGAALDLRNRIIPHFLGDGNQSGVLNQLAGGLAGRVNSLLQAGQASSGPPAIAGQALFGFDSSSPSTIAKSLHVEALDPSALAAISPGPPYQSNGTALALAALQNSHDPADQIDGMSFLDFYAHLAAGIGSETQRAQNNKADHELYAAQARSLRQEMSGVSLDEEAVQLMELQRSYEATARLVTVVDELTQTVLNMLR